VGAVDVKVIVWLCGFATCASTAALVELQERHTAVTV